MLQGSSLDPTAVLRPAVSKGSWHRLETLGSPASSSHSSHPYTRVLRPALLVDFNATDADATDPRGCPSLCWQDRTTWAKRPFRHLDLTPSYEPCDWKV